MLRSPPMLGALALGALLCSSAVAQQRVRTGQATPPVGTAAIAEHPNAGSPEKRGVGVWRPQGFLPPSNLFVVYEEQLIADPLLLREDSEPSSAVYDPTTDSVLVAMRSFRSAPAQPFYWIDAQGQVSLGPALPPGVRGADALAVVPTPAGNDLFFSAIDKLFRFDRGSGTWTQVATIATNETRQFLFWAPRTRELIVCLRGRFEAFETSTFTKRTGTMDLRLISPQAAYLPEIDVLVNEWGKILDTSRSHWDTTDVFGTTRVGGTALVPSTRRGDPFFVNSWSSGLRQPQTYDFGVDPSSVSYGSGCNGVSGVFPAPVLQPLAPGQGLSPGETSEFVVTDLLPLSSLALVIGSQQTSIDLTRFGFFGCTQLASLDLLVPVTQFPGATVTVPITLPDEPGLIGATIYLQVFENLATGAPRVFASNGLEARVGVR